MFGEPLDAIQAMWFEHVGVLVLQRCLLRLLHQARFLSERKPTS